VFDFVFGFELGSCFGTLFFLVGRIRKGSFEVFLLESLSMSLAELCFARYSSRYMIFIDRKVRSASYDSDMCYNGIRARKGRYFIE
jgi:hypothetical protein